MTVKKKRSLVAACIGLAALAGVGVFAVVTSSGWSLACDKDRGICTHAEWQVSRAFGSAAEIRLAEIQEAVIATGVKNRKGDRDSTTALLVGGKVHVIDKFWGSEGDPRVGAWAAGFNAFLADPRRARFEDESERVWPFVAWCALFALVAASWLAPTAVVIDRARGRVRVRGGLGRAREVALDAVVQAELHPVEGEGRFEGRLMLADGTHIAITDSGNVSNGEKRRFVQAVNTALATAA